MNKLSKELLRNNDSYIEALQQAINIWKNASSFEDKQTSIISIGEIGKEINKQNKLLNVK